MQARGRVRAVQQGGWKQHGMNGGQMQIWSSVGERQEQTLDAKIVSASLCCLPALGTSHPNLLWPLPSAPHRPLRSSPLIIITSGHLL